MGTDPTEAEIQAAWERADEIPGQDPQKLRLVSADRSGAVIKRDNYGQRVDFGWLVDERGNARHHRYRLSDAIGAQRKRISRQQGEQKIRRRERLKASTEELNVSDVVTLFERVADLEAVTKQQASQIKELSNAIKRIARVVSS